jgi:hypothetical protein
MFGKVGSVFLFVPLEFQFHASRPLHMVHKRVHIIQFLGPAGITGFFADLAI